MKYYQSLEEHDKPEPHLQINEQENRTQIDRYRKIIYCVLVALTVITTWLNLFSSQSPSSKYQILQKSKSNLSDSSNSQQIISILQKEYDDSLYNISLSSKSLQRISYGQPRPKNSFIKAVIFQKKTQQIEMSQCLLTNGITIISNKTTQTAKKFLQNSQIYKWIILLPSTDVVADQLIEKLMKQTLNIYQKNSFQLTIDSDYMFLSSYINQCETLIYIQNNFVVDAENVKKIVAEGKNAKLKIQEGFMGYSTKAKNEQGKQITLNNLKQLDLQKIPQQQFYKHIYILDPSFLSLITPLNFANYNRYTIEQMMIYPILALTQKSQKLFAIEKPYYVFDEAVYQFKQFILSSPKKNLDNKKSFCFVSYPSVPTEMLLLEFQEYVDSVVSSYTSDNTMAIILYLPYKFNTPQSELFQVYKIVSKIKQKNPTFRIRIRLQLEKAVSSLAVYQTVHTYCPLDSIVLSSRMNVIFQKNIVSKVKSALSQKFHYYLSSNDSSLLESQTKNKSRGRSTIANLPAQLFELHIFKLQLMQMIHVWALKSDENSFYESQASFVIPMLEMVGYSVSNIQKLYTIKNKRKQTLVQNIQLKNLKNYGRWDKIKDNILRPIQYNSLTNLDLRRGSLEVVPRIIHQIWLKDTDLGTKSLKLQSSIRRTHRNYKYMLWKKENITRQDFPMSYIHLAKIIQYEYSTGRSYHPWLEALLRYEVLYNHGGIYLSLQTEAIKPLDPFLKYELFFAGYYNTIGDYGSPQSIGAEVIGTKKHGYHMRFIIAQLITQQRLRLQLTDYEALVGGDMIRVSLTNNQIYTTAAFGFNLFTYDPYRIGGLCHQKQTNCQEYKQAYLVLHNLV